jgi:hypothetical protein
VLRLSCTSTIFTASCAAFQQRRGIPKEMIARLLDDSDLRRLQRAVMPRKLAQRSRHQNPPR